MPQNLTKPDISAHDPRLTPAQDRAILALVMGTPVEKAAKSINVHYRTLHRWMNETYFRKTYHETRRNVIEQAASILASTAQDAANTLKKNLTCGVPQVEIRAACAILDMGLRGMEVLEMEERLYELEQRLEILDAEKQTAKMRGRLCR